MSRRTLLALTFAAVAYCQGCTTVAHTDTDIVLAVVPLQHASAAELVETLQQFPLQKTQVMFVADTRSNSVILQGLNADVENARKAIEALDRKVE